MIRNTLMAGFLIAVAAAAVATAHAGKDEVARPLPNVTVIAKNSPFPVLGPITVDPCGVEDCSDVK
jgi:hypothetical protein